MAQRYKWRLTNQCPNLITQTRLQKVSSTHLYILTWEGQCAVHPSRCPANPASKDLFFTSSIIGPVHPVLYFTPCLISTESYLSRYNPPAPRLTSPASPCSDKASFPLPLPLHNSLASLTCRFASWKVFFSFHSHAEKTKRTQHYGTKNSGKKRSLLKEKDVYESSKPKRV